MLKALLARKYSTPPNVYRKIQEIMSRSAKTNPENDHQQAEHDTQEKRDFLTRLRQDGGDRILRVKQTFFHIKHVRFIPICMQLKGLTLNQALLQLSWNSKTSAKKYGRILEESIIAAKESGFDLKKTYIGKDKCIILAESIAKDGGKVSQQLKSRYLRGRGRYGSTMFPEISTVDIILQERSQPFRMKSEDPLEWVRDKLRDSQRNFVNDAEQVYALRRKARPVKTVYA